MNTLVNKQKREKWAFIKEEEVPAATWLPKESRGILLFWFCYSSPPEWGQVTDSIQRGSFSFPTVNLESSDSQPALCSVPQKSPWINRTLNTAHASGQLRCNITQGSQGIAHGCPCLGGIPHVAACLRFEVSRLPGTKGLVPRQD